MNWEIVYALCKQYTDSVTGGSGGGSGIYLKRAYIENGHLKLEMSDGTKLDAGNIGAIDDNNSSSDYTYSSLKIDEMINEVNQLIQSTGEELQENKADKTDLLYSNVKPIILPHGGIKSGTTFNNVLMSEMLTKILYPWVAPIVSVEIIPPIEGIVFEKGDSRTITAINVNVTKQSSNITKVEVYNNSTLIGTKSESELVVLNETGSAILSFAVNETITTNTIFIAKVTDESGEITSDDRTEFDFVYPYYWGAIAADVDINESNVKSLNKLIASKTDKQLVYNTNNQKMIFASPCENGEIRKIVDPNGFNATNIFTRSEISIIGLDNTPVQYYVYESNAATLTSFEMTFLY